MTVHFIGAGPGAADLITLRGARVLGECPTCLYAGSLVPQELLELCPAGATLIDTARMPLDEIIGHIVEADASGADVARLAMLTPQTVHGIIGNLERAELISRSPHPVHGRVQVVVLTKAGRTLLALVAMAPFLALAAVLYWGGRRPAPGGPGPARTTSGTAPCTPWRVRTRTAR